MHFAPAFIAAVVAVLITEVSAHGYVPQIKIGSQYVAGWDISKDPYTTPQVRSVILA